MAIWRKGQPWRVVRGLDRLNAQIRTACPRAVPPATPVTSWGSIADDEHSSASDHYPHVYSALGATAVVCARDFPHAPQLGLDAHAIAEQLRLSRDARIGYVISDGRITGPGHGWRWDRYDGTDPHDTHIHVSSVHTAAADDTRDWQIGDDMGTLDQPQQSWLYNASRHVGDLANMNPVTASMGLDGKVVNHDHKAVRAIIAARDDAAAAKALAQQVLAEVRALAARPPADVDEQALAAALAPLFQPGVTLEQLRQVLAGTRLTPGV